MRPPPGGNDLLDRRPAHQAGKAFPCVNTMPLLERAAAAFGVHIVRYRRAAMLDRLAQNFIDRFKQSQRTTLANTPRGRPDPRAEQGFIRVDVADPAKNRLIQKNRLDRRVALQCFRRQGRQRIGSEPLHALRAELDRAKHSLIVIKQHGVIEHEDRSRMRPRMAAKKQLPRHPEMNRQASFAELDHNELAVPAHIANPAARQHSRDIDG